MAAQESPRLGVCPCCSEKILPRHILIQYETASGEEEAWTECPSCGEVAIHNEFIPAEGSETVSETFQQRTV